VGELRPLASLWTEVAPRRGGIQSPGEQILAGVK